MPRTSLAAIVASLHGRSGKTLLARILAEYWLMAGERPLIFDTDAADRKLRDFFPDQAIVVDLHHVRDQMRLFDTLAAPSPQPRVVDVTHRSLGTFFNVMRNTDFVVEARSCHVEPVIFYMVDRSAESFEEGWDLRDRFEDCAFVVVDNAFLGEAGERVRHSGAYRALAAHDLRFDVPALDRRHFELIDDPYLSLAEFMRQPISLGEGASQTAGELPRDARMTIRLWLLRLFKEVYRIIEALERSAAFTRQPMDAAPEPSQSRS